jgi:hypothetical protein
VALVTTGVEEFSGSQLEMGGQHELVELVDFVEVETEN